MDPSRSKKRPLSRMLLFVLPGILLLFLHNNLSVLLRNTGEILSENPWEILSFLPPPEPPTRAPQLLKNYWRDETETTVNHTFNPRSGVSEEYSIQYQNFTLHIPHFVSKQEEDQFLFTEYHHWLKKPEIARRGTISVVPNGTYDRRDDCGFLADYSKHLPKQNANESINIVHNETAVALDDIPARYFQHFMDSGVAKLAQATLYLQDHPNATVYAHFSNNGKHMIDQIVRKLGFANTQFNQMSRLTGPARELVLVCQTPPIHPAPWQKVRELLGIHNLTKGGKKVIYVTRNKQNSKHGRVVLNDAEVQKFLQTRYGSERVVTFDSNKYPDLESTMNLFANASIILGMHGGGLYNTLFAPTNAVLIEVMPVKTNGLPFGAAHEIFWLIGSILRQQYWRLPIPMKGTNADVAVNLTQLEQALDVIDSGVQPVRQSGRDLEDRRIALVSNQTDKEILQNSSPQQYNQKPQPQRKPLRKSPQQLRDQEILSIRRRKAAEQRAERLSKPASQPSSQLGDRLKTDEHEQELKQAKEELKLDRLLASSKPQQLKSNQVEQPASNTPQQNNKPSKLNAASSVLRKS